MSIVLKMPYNGSSKRIYLIYDFKQVSDSILLIMYIDDLNRWKKFFINYEDGAWNTDILTSYTNGETLQQIRNKLKGDFQNKVHKLNELTKVLLEDQNLTE